MRYLVSAVVALLTLTSCGGGGDGSAAPETVTVTAESEGDQPDAEEPPADEPTPSGDDGAVLVIDQPVTIGPDDDGDTAEVTLHSVTYPRPKGDDVDSLGEGNVFVQVEWTVKNIGRPAIYGVPVYPNFETVAGQVREAEWEIGLYGDYGSEGFEDEMPDSLSPGQFASGWNIYEVPAEGGQLIFPFGPGEVRVAVDPPA